MGWKSNLTEDKFYYIVGLSGIYPRESRSVQNCGKILSALMVAVAIVLLVQWQWELLRKISPHTSFVINVIVFSFFIVAYLTELLIVRGRWRFIGQNWSIPIIIVAALPFLFEYKPLMTPLAALRPMLAIYILFPSLKMLINFFFDGNLRTTLLGATVVVVIFGVLIAGVDSNVKTVWDGMWWALATVTTVGYGDVVPATALGRLLGAILVVLGLAIFVIVTANILAFTLKRERKESKICENDLYDEMQQIKAQQEKQMALLEDIAKRLEP